MKHERAWAYAAFTVVCLVWGTTYLGIAIALETIPPLLLTATRFVFAGIVLLVVAKVRGDVIPRDARTLGNLALIGFLLITIGNLAVVWAEQWVPSGLAALLVATAPFWMAIIELFRRNGERVSLQSGIGMAIGFLGVGVLVSPGITGNLKSGFLLGALAIQVGGICWQLGSAHAKYNVAHVSPMVSAALQMLMGGIIVGIGGFALGEASRFTLNPRTFGALAYLTVFGSIIAYSAYIFALAHLRTTVTSLYAYINPVVAVFLGWLVLSEPLTSRSILAMVIILAGVALVQSARVRAKKPIESTAEPVKKAA